MERTATIQIVNLRLRTYIGFNPDEREKPQDVVINAGIEHRVSPAALHDDVSGALDYKVITKAIIRHVEDGRFLLLEKLVNDIIEICSRDAAVIKATVAVEKPHALRFADSVSLHMTYEPTQPLFRNEGNDGKRSRSPGQTA